MDLFDSWQENGLVALIDEQGCEVSYGQLHNDVSAVIKQLPSFKSLVFLQVSNEYQSVVTYFACVFAKHPVLLLENDLATGLLSDLIDCYNPNLHVSSIDFQLRHEERLDLHKDLCLLLSTSGSTGSPKLVRLSFENIFSNSKNIAEYLNLSETNSAITTLPMSYSFGLSIVNSHLLSGVGSSIVLSNHSVVSREFWEIVNKYKVTSFSGVPYLFQMLKKMKYNRFDTSSIRCLTQAGGRLDIESIQYFSQMCKERNQEFIVMYGQTEASPRISYVPYSRLDEKIGSIGTSIPNGKLKIVDGLGSVILEPEVNGEIVYEGPNVMLGYAQSQADLSLGDVINGSLNTGDLGYFDSDGYFYVTGRLKRFIKIYGLRVGLDEIESWLMKSDIVSAAVGMDDNLNVYILGDNIDAERLKNDLASEFKFNVRAITINTIDDFPRTANGKIKYSVLEGITKANSKGRR